MANVKTWVVEEKNEKGEIVFRHEYTDHSEALGIFNQLVELSENFVSIHKSDKRLLLE